jgi:hypothetical protein
MHFNETGQRVVAEHIAAYLLARHAQELRRQFKACKFAIAFIFSPLTPLSE